MMIYKDVKKWNPKGKKSLILCSLKLQAVNSLSGILLGDSQNMTKSSIAKKMKTSRVAVDNILDPTFNTSIDSLERFAYALGKKLTISLR